jgi:hypothetical protein
VLTDTVPDFLKRHHRLAVDGERASVAMTLNVRPIRLVCKPNRLSERAIWSALACRHRLPFAQIGFTSTSRPYSAT